jgi:hypothetical protein
MTRKTCSSSSPPSALSPGKPAGLALGHFYW